MDTSSLGKLHSLCCREKHLLRVSSFVRSAYGVIAIEAHSCYTLLSKGNNNVVILINISRVIVSTISRGDTKSCTILEY